MSGNRGQYTSTPLYNMKKHRAAEQKPDAAQSGQPLAQAQRAPLNSRYQWLALLLVLALPVLFILSLLVPSAALRWTFLILAAVAVVAMWVLKAFVLSARNTLTVVYTALAVVIGLALFISSQSQPGTEFSNPQRNNQNSISQNPGINYPSDNAIAAAEPTPEVVSAAYQRLNEFMEAWQSKRVVNMIPFCSPEWKNRQASPETALYQLLQNAYPLEFAIEGIEGSDGDTARIASVKVRMHELNGESVQRLRVVLVRPNDVWYVDPNSLSGVVINEAEEAAAAAGQANQNPNINTTKAPPTPTPNLSGVKVYYNADGGQYYHATSNCSTVREEYWPLTEIPFELINSAEYARLKPCPRCNPPERPNAW